MLETKIKENGLLDKPSISNLAKSFGLNTKLAALGTKSELKAKQDKIMKLQAFDSSYLCGKSHVEDDGTQKLFIASISL